MTLIADILLIAGAFSVAFYCIVLSRRLSRFTDLEKGVGGAIAVLSAQVDDMTKTLTRAQKTAAGSALKLEEHTNRAESASQRLELLIASLHDLPSAPQGSNTPSETVQPEPAPTPTNTSSPAQFSSQRTRMEAAE